MKYATILSLLILTLVAGLTLTGCSQKEAPPTVATPPTVPATYQGEWCAEHGVPEEVCTRCHANLVAEFKQKGDWCKEHGLPKTQCIQCDPSLEAKWAALAPKAK